MGLVGLFVVIVLTEVPAPSAPPLPEPGRTCERAADCEKGFACLGYRELEPGRWTRGTCTALPTPAPAEAQPPLLVICTTDEDCSSTERCTDYRRLSDDRWTRGVCLDRGGFRDPRAVDPRYLGGARERRPFTGTVPAGFTLVTEPNWLAITPGIIVFASSWLFGTAVSFALGQPVGAVPLVGPVLASTALGSAGSLVAAAITDCLVQSMGASLIIFGLVTPRRFVESMPAVTLSPTPGGLVVSGRF